MGGPASSIPRVSPTEAEWTRDVGQALVQGHGECVQSDNAGMSAMMVVLKLCRVRQDTLSSVLEEAGKAMAAQHKFRLRAHKYRRRADACGRAQREVDEIRGIANYRLQQWGQTARERDELHNQLMNLTIERGGNTRVGSCDLSQRCSFGVSRRKTWGLDFGQPQRLSKGASTTRTA